jgi:hypothetical protein
MECGYYYVQCRDGSAWAIVWVDDDGCCLAPCSLNHLITAEQLGKKYIIIGKVKPPARLAPQREPPRPGFIAFT